MSERDVQDSLKFMREKLRKERKHRCTRGTNKIK